MTRMGRSNFKRAPSESSVQSAAISSSPRDQEDIIVSLNIAGLDCRDRLLHRREDIRGAHTAASTPNATARIAPCGADERAGGVERQCGDIGIEVRPTAILISVPLKKILFDVRCVERSYSR